MYVCMYVCMYEFMYVCVGHVCTYVYLYMYILHTDRYEGPLATVGLYDCAQARVLLRNTWFSPLYVIVNPRKLEHGFRMILAGIPYALHQVHEDNDVPTCWLLLYGNSVVHACPFEGTVAVLSPMAGACSDGL